MQSVLLGIHRQLGANFIDRGDIPVVHDYGDVNAEVHAATNESGIIELADYAVMRVEGKDGVAAFAQISQIDLSVMTFGVGKHVTMRDWNEQRNSDLIVLARESGFWVYATEQDLHTLGVRIRAVNPNPAWTWLDRREPIVILSVQGAFAAESLGRSIGRAIALNEYHWGTMSFFDGELTIVKHARTGVDGYDLLVPSEHAEIFWEIITANHACPFGYKALDQARSEAGLNSKE